MADRKSDKRLLVCLITSICVRRQKRNALTADVFIHTLLCSLSTRWHGYFQRGLILKYVPADYTGLNSGNGIISRNDIASVIGRQPTATNRSLVLMPDACHVIGHRQLRGPTRTNAKVQYHFGYRGEVATDNPVIQLR